MKTLHLIILTYLLVFAASTNAVEQITYYHSDASGSPIAATDDTGNLLWDQAYDPWGVAIPSASADPRGFTGASRDSDTGFSDMQARWYSPQIGRMLATDPVSFHEDNIQSFNLYAYGNNNPYRYVDPNGESPIEVFTELMPAAGRSFAALTAYGVGLATGDVYLQNTALEAMGEMRTENLMAIASIYAPPGVGRTAMIAKQGDNVTKKTDDIIYRMGTSKESKTRLGNKAQEAEDVIGNHGVSGSTTKPDVPCSSASCSSLEAAGFKVTPTPTRRDPNHVTIELPKPVTKEVADKFNSVFGR